VSESRSSFGGLGAVFFLAAFGAIAFFVQRQSIPEDRDELRKPVTVLPELEDEEAPAPVPWQDRIALDAMQLTPIGQALPPSNAAGSDESAGAVDLAQVDKTQARFVQALGDGHELLFSLDPVLQESALTIFRNREVPYGAAVMLDLRDNSVLTMAGYSKMDPQVDPLEIVTTAWAPAASTFKLVTTASLLAHDKASPNSKECFHSGLHGITDDLLKDSPSLDTRCESLSSAIAHSYNLVIAKLALKHLDQASLVETAQALLYETDIPFEFPIERSPALIPADGNARAKVAAGFWHVDLSPMHAALMASIFARGGIYQPPHLISQVRGPDGSELTAALPKTERVLDKETADAVAKMMVRTTTGGTAKKSFYDAQGTPYVPEAKVAGKTGSLTGKRAPSLNYNWFIGFAPAEKPEIAFAVLLANEPQWRIKAHYAARRLVQIYLQRREAITEQREARLTGKGLSLPKRDPETGAVLPASEKAAELPKEELPPVPGPTKAAPAAAQP
jgi:cell division protein FtsI/penicillin-binding protein 2